MQKPPASTRLQTKLYGTFCAVFAALFLFLALDSLLNPRGPMFTYKVLPLAVCTVACGALVWGAWLLWQRVPAWSPRTLRRTAGGLLFACLCVQLVCGFALRVGECANWDFGIVLTAAMDNALHGTLPGEYFGLWGNNSPLYVLSALLLRIPAALWGTREACYNFLVVINCLSANAALWLLYAAAKRLCGAKNALFFLVCSAVLVPFWAYTPIVYTDTITLAFPIGIMVLWLKLRAVLTCDAAQTPPYGWHGTLLRAALLGILCGIGATLKVTVIIALAAVLLDAVLCLPWRRALAVCGAAAAGCIVCMAMLGALVQHTPLLPAYDKNLAIPYTHWVMMGLHGDGGYYDPDYGLTMTEDTYEGRVALNWREIGARVQAFGPVGLLHHAADKLSFTWGDGMYYAPRKLSIWPMSQTPLHRFLLPGAPLYGVACYAFTGLQIAMLLGISVGAWRAWRRKEHSATVLRIAVFGLALFLLVWETRSRYLVNFLPLIALCGCTALCPRKEDT